MVYEKPEVAVLGDSLKAIQSIPKSSSNTDSGTQMPRDLVTASAYEADE